MNIPPGLAALSVAILIAIGSHPANAATKTFTFNAPSGLLQDAPVTATLTDVAAGVKLDVSTKFGASSLNYVDLLDFNVNTNSASFIRGITITRTDSGSQRAVWSKGLNNLKAESIKNLDIGVGFGNSNRNNGQLRLDHTETVSFVLSASGLNANLFTQAVMHVAGLKTSGGARSSATEVGAVPLPAALPLFGSALLGVGGFGMARRKHKKAKP